ncbi:MAG: hypothetical protein LCH92_08070 [Proteobacteria bacterium]|nr:hypothetical protein [Pseudomonadota bacterium]
MKLVDNWRQVALRSHSMRAFYLGMIALWAPELLYRLLGYDPVAPWVFFALANILFVYGPLGRLVKQPKVSG